MPTLQDSINFFDTFNTALFNKLLEAKKQPKKNKFKKLLAVKTVFFGNENKF